MTKIHETDALICGGGPCGLMLANELGRRGIRCLLVDQKPSTAFNPQANATQARTMEHFRRLGFAHKVRRLGLPADHPTDIAYLTQFAGKELARLRLPTAAAATELIKTLKGSWSAAELPHRVSQKFVEVTLRDEAQQWPTVDIRYGWEMQNFTDSGDGVSATVAKADGSEVLQVRAKYLVGADGARSKVRAQLGIGWEGGTGYKRSFMGGKMFAVYLKAPDFYRQNPNDRAWMYVMVNPALRAFIMSVDGQGEFAFHTQIPEGVDGDAFTDDDARRFFAQASGLDISIEILAKATWLAGHALVAGDFQRGRVFLGGDAVHLFTPTGGLGYNTAVEDAVNLGWKLAAVIKGQAPPTLLDSYGLERKPVALRNTGYARQFADSIGLFEAVAQLDDDTPAGVAARSAASDYLNGHVRREFNIPGVTFGGRYDGSPIIVSDGATPPPDSANVYEPTGVPGGRPPHAWLDDGRSLYDLFGFEWTVLTLAEDPTASAAFVSAADQLGVPLTPVHHPSPELLALYGAPVVLIRPDHMVAWRGDSGAKATQILRQCLGYGLVVTTLDQQAVTELYAMREVLEGAAAAFAARHATAAEIANMDAILLEFENGRDPVAHNQTFHQAIYSAAHNRHLIRSLKSLTDSTFLLGRSTLATPSRAEISHTEHCEMLDAIRSRDEDLARETAQNHIRHALLERLKLLRKNPAV